MSRIYMIGTNSPNYQWSLPVTPPETLRSHVTFERYTEFVNAVNRHLAWKKSERVKHKLLKIFYPCFVP